MERITLVTGGKKTEVLIGEGIAEEVLAEKTAGRKTFVLADEIAAERTGFSFGFSSYRYPYRGGEENKTFRELGKIIGAAAEAGLHRNDLFLSFGGGVAGDLGGLAASLYMRGIDHGILPTTLLAMADSSIGGKTAVDFGEYKNLIGTFCQPTFVLTDFAFLKTLPEREWLSGAGEIAKTALLCPSIGKKMKENFALRKDRGFLLSLVPDCVRFKGEIVSEDEREKTGRRKILNAGHTVGHMLEMRYREKSHGEYVLEGLYYENKIAEKIGAIDPSVAKETEEFILSLIGKPTYVHLEKGAEIAFMDKKNNGNNVSFVAIAGEGKTKEIVLTQKRFGDILVDL